MGWLLLLLASNGCVRVGFSRGDGPAPASDVRTEVIGDVDLATFDLDAAKPDAAKPDAARPDAAKPDAARPDAAKPDAAKPDAAKPDAAKPYALAFNGIDANVDLGAMLYTSPPAALTVEAWIKPAAFPSPFAHVIFNGRNGQWTFTLDSSELSAGVNIGSAWYRVYLDAAASAQLVGKWHHVAMTWSQATQQVELFVDGTSRGTLPTPSGQLTTLMTGYRPTIGSYCTISNSYSNFFPGLIDEVRIWNVTRTQAQLKGSMTLGLKGNEPGLIGYWRFDHGSGSTAYDSSAAGHDGTINNATWTGDTPF